VLERDSTKLRVIVMWEHITAGDKKIELPSTAVLARIHDARAVQFWDDERALSRVMDAELPLDTLRSVAEFDSAGRAVAWDCVALYRAGRQWEQRFPVPDWAGRPVSAVAETALVRLQQLERAAPPDSSK
jgi:hypothetical protein